MKYNSRVLAEFLVLLYKAYNDLYFTYLEINPLGKYYIYISSIDMIYPIVVKGDQIYMLDLAAKLDSTAEFICKKLWEDVDFPPPFGRDAFPEVINVVIYFHLS